MSMHTSTICLFVILSSVLLLGGAANQIPYVSAAEPTNEGPAQGQPGSESNPVEMEEQVKKTGCPEGSHAGPSGGCVEDTVARGGTTYGPTTTPSQNTPSTGADIPQPGGAGSGTGSPAGGSISPTNTPGQANPTEGKSAIEKAVAEGCKIVWSVACMKGMEACAASGGGPGPWGKAACAALTVTCNSSLGSNQCDQIRLPDLPKDPQPYRDPPSECIGHYCLTNPVTIQEDLGPTDPESESLNSEIPSKPNDDDNDSGPADPDDEDEGRNTGSSEDSAPSDNDEGGSGGDSSDSGPEDDSGSDSGPSD